MLNKYKTPSTNECKSKESLIYLFIFMCVFLMGWLFKAVTDRIINCAYAQAHDPKAFTN